MANFFSRLFGSQKQGYDYQGPKPYGTLTQAKGGQEYYDQLVKRAIGRQDLGFGDTYAEKYANPIVQNMRGQFESYQLPELKSELSATGRRRGSGGFDQLRRAYQEQGLQEGDVFSRLQQRNEDQIRQELNQAISGLGDYATQDAAMRAQLAAFESGNTDKQYAQANAQKQAESQGLNRALAGGVSLALAPFTGGATLATIPGLMSGTSSGYSPSFNWDTVGGYGKSGMNTPSRKILRELMRRA